MRSDVVAMVKDFFLSGVLHPSLDNTNIVLIPKVVNPSSLNHYRPISLCNVLYTVISKIIANRLKSLLNKLVCPT